MYVISARVQKTINSLPETDRQPISRALDLELRTGANPQRYLTPIQYLVYSMIRFYVKQDTERQARQFNRGSEPCGCAL